MSVGVLYDTETLLWVAHKKIETAINDTITYETVGTVTGLPDTLDKARLVIENAKRIKMPG